MLSKKQRLIKRIFDLLLIFVTLPLYLSFYFIIAFLVRIFMGKPILFKENRAGWQGQVFTMCKFRTMNEARDEKGMLLPPQIRITKFGHFLRSSSFDELPELWNVIKGEMSLVGPRPLGVRYLERYTAQQKRRHIMKPGLTGWAQINGRNIISWKERFDLDVWYVDHWSLMLDLKIILLTIWKVLKRDEIGPEDNPIMEEFRGNQNGN